MIKQTLMFSNPVSLSLKDNQLVITFKDTKNTVTRPIEDIGFVIIENPMVSITIPLLNELADNNVSVVFCDKKQMPKTILMTLEAYYVLFVFFDLPVVTKKERKIAATFRKNLMKDGFVMLQFSVYIRHCASKEIQNVHIKRVKSIVPETGMVSMLSVTDKQYGDIVNFWGKEKKKKVPTDPMQLEFF